MPKHESQDERGPPVTVLLESARNGDIAARNQVFALVLDDLERMAHAKLARRREGITLGTHGLVNQAYLRIAPRQRPWLSRGQFFAELDKIMKSCIEDHRRKKRAAKRGGGKPAQTLDALDALDEPASRERESDLRSLADVFVRLHRVSPDAARIASRMSISGCSWMAAARDVGISSVRQADALRRTTKSHLRDWLSDGSERSTHDGE